MNVEMECPLAGEIEEAKRNPNGWVYRIAGVFRENEAIPPQAIVGAWQVDGNGHIVGDFQRNPNYDPVRHPS
jgi:hypothetical protein